MACGDNTAVAYWQVDQRLPSVPKHMFTVIFG